MVAVQRAARWVGCERTCRWVSSVWETGALWDLRPNAPAADCPLRPALIAEGTSLETALPQLRPELPGSGSYGSLQRRDDLCRGSGWVVGALCKVVHNPAPDYCWGEGRVTI